MTASGHGATLPETPEFQAVAHFETNRLGRDFVVGDLHGMFDHLRALMAEVGFDGDRDRLFSVGDLVDRGPGSARALEWLGEPWFHACRGNHEQFVIDSVDPGQRDFWVACNGGAWWLDLAPAEQDRFRNAFGRMPLALEIETRHGRVGVVHADVPPLIAWDEFVRRLRRGDRDSAFHAMWSRERIGDPDGTRVPGRVDRIYCGHTPARRTLRRGNVYYIDTGAVYVHHGYADARLTMVGIHPERHREFSIGTALRV